MKILDFIGQLLRPAHSDASHLIEAQPQVNNQPQTITVSSPVFQNGQPIPTAYGPDGRAFPEIRWANLPAGTQSVLLVVEDPDAPKAEPFVHGIFYNIPVAWGGIATANVTANGLSEEARAAGISMGTNSLSKAAYMAPAPPPGHGVHHYHFQVIAIDSRFLFTESPSLKAIKEALQERVLAWGELVGTYER